MQKTTFKTFLCSFVVSLSTILIVDRVFFYTPELPHQKTKISSKNITLFLKPDIYNGLTQETLPVKKIALTLPVVKTENNIIKEDTPEVIIEENISEKNDILPNISEKQDEQLFASANIPLEQAANVPAKPQQDLSLGADVSDKLEENFETEKVEDIPVLNPQKISQPEKEIIVAQNNISENTDEQKPSEDTSTLFSQKRADELFSKREQTLSLTPTSLIVEKREKGKTHILQKEIAQNDISKRLPDIPEDEKLEEVVIPLEKSTSTKKVAQNLVKNSDDAGKNSVALASKNTSIKSMDAESIAFEKEKAKNIKKEWISMKEKEQAKNSNPWKAAHGNQQANNSFINEAKNAEKNTFSAQTTDANGIQIAAETVQNLLIPIPEEIMKEENIVPQLISSPKNKELEQELEAKGLIVKKEEKKEEPEKKASNTQQSTSKKESLTAESKDESGGIFKSLGAIFSDTKEKIEIGETPEEEENKNSLFSAFTKKQKKFISKILPTEIRLSFQPNRAEISGQTLKWIKAFAQKTAEEENVGLEIRIDGTSSPILQRRRLNLLQNILLSEGANPQKINTVFTAREPNSFILRTVLISNEGINTKIRNTNNYMQW